MGVGPATARIFIIGEQPGDREDITGHPFGGPSGQLLRQALREIGIDMEGVYTSPMPSNTSATTCEANAGYTKRRPRPMCSAACNGWRLSCGRSRLQPSSRWGAPPSAPSNAWPSSCRQQQCPIPRICPPWRRSVARSGGDGALRWWTLWRSLRAYSRRRSRGYRGLPAVAGGTASGRSRRARSSMNRCIESFTVLNSETFSYSNENKCPTCDSGQLRNICAVSDPAGPKRFGPVTISRRGSPCRLRKRLQPGSPQPRGLRQNRHPLRVRPLRRTR